MGEALKHAVGPDPAEVVAENPGGASEESAKPPSRAPLVLLGVLSAVFFALRVPLVLSTGALIFDENYYVNAARTILGRELPAEAPYFGQAPGADPNLEHPPLGKLGIAAGIAVFGDGPAGWRAASVVAGSLALLALYWLVRSAGGGGWVALGAAAVLAADNLFMVHGSIGTLDVMVLPFMLAGVALHLRGRPVAAGAALGVGGCVKLVGLLGIPVVLLVEAGRLAASRRAPGGPSPAAGLKKAGLLAGVAAASYLGGIFVLDAAVTDLPRHPFAHTRYMLQYSLDAPAAPRPQPGLALAPASQPLEWLINKKPINYQRRTVPGPSGPRAALAFEGKMNPFVIFAALPALAAAAAGWWRRRAGAGLLAAAWFAGTFLPMALIAAGHRYNYLYYMLPVLPGIAAGIAVALAGQGRSRRVVRLAYAAAVVFAAVALYPLRIPGEL